MLLKNCRLIPEITEDFSGNRADVLIEKNIIVDIKTPGEIIDYEGEELDLSGCTLLPGLFDLHCHLCWDRIDDYSGMNDKEEAYTCIDAYTFARAYLMQGFTTLRDAGTIHEITVKLIKMREENKIDLIPDIISSVRALTPTNPSNEEYKGMYQVCDGPNEVRKAARMQFEKGADVIKYITTGCFFDSSGVPGITIATEDELKAAVDIARTRGSYVMAHAHGADGIKKCIRAGVHTVEHCSFIDDEGISMFKKSDSYIVPTGGIGLASLMDESRRSLPEIINKKTKEYEAIERESINKAYREGLKMGFGSDVDMKDFIDYPGIEFRARREWYDFSPIDILLQATKYSAEIAGMIDKKGTIKIGKNAEMVAVEGNPDEDIYVMTKLPKYVFFKGEVI